MRGVEGEYIGAVADVEEACAHRLDDPLGPVEALNQSCTIAARTGASGGGGSDCNPGDGGVRDPDPWVVGTALTIWAMGDLAAIVVNYRRPDLLCPCLASLESALARAGGGELVVVDNGSADGSAELVRREFPRATVVALEANRGFGGGVNAGLRCSNARWVFLMNNDATVESDALTELRRVGDAAGDVAAVAAQMRFADRPDRINSAGLEIDRLGIAYDRLVGAAASESESVPTEVFGASAGAVLYRRAALEDVGCFDESFFVFMEDADVAWRMRMRGWRCMYAPTALAHHHHSATAVHASDRKYFHVGRNRVRLLARNADRRLLVEYGGAMVAYDGQMKF